ncbi:fimbrial protein [Providencia huaxiensis]|uniref:Type 1 fimbrial protein n=1 Tax=Providencia huaxiensis TaxID=2027290 RepID=A0A8I2IP64_9GAMM|nr:MULTISPECIES: fimbrial protein [Providencia]MBN6359807.1 type 1 fimbrial protein [Providencia huaxiensis]MBQ0269896.1 type 1 fimbrial protein [Providencia huaxiensis]MBQ0534716.1 type 1 fimbrial protein [Providencia huaxiensis]MBQ0589245.1 type 1 fimbrial protein [Providencia huaxiensis]MDI7240255.1 fimbrial protein [Providencia huaxiensis]
MSKAILLLSLGFPIFAWSMDSLDVEFSGILVNKTCQLAADSINKRVTIENIRLKSINDNIPSDITPFFITIEKCSQADLNKMIKITWKSPKQVAVEGDNYLGTDGNSGVLLGVVDKQRVLVTWDKSIEVTPVTVTDGTQQLEFGVFVRKNPLNEAKKGFFSSSATFSLEYE